MKDKILFYQKNGTSFLADNESDKNFLLLGVYHLLINIYIDLIQCIVFT